MAMNLFEGFGTMIACLALQCIVVSILLQFLFVLERKNFIKPTLFGASSLLTIVLVVLLAGNFLQISLWAGLFYVSGEFKDFATAFYHSVVNFSTLGYGDLVMSEERRLLGALEAANGVLMFGLTTGFLYMILSELMQQAWDLRVNQDTQCNESIHHRYSR
jgi:hypothetical protein